MEKISRLPIGHGVSLIIPAFNEEKTIANVIERCAKQLIVSQLVVVNDGSLDNTKRVLDCLEKKYLKRKNGVLLTVIHHEHNKGKGEGIKTGLRSVKGKYVMVQDADLEYFPEEIVSLFKVAEKSRHGIVFGSRTQYEKKGYLLAQVGNWYLNQMFNLLYGLRLTDAYTCYKFIPRKIWKEMRLLSSGFEIDAELISKLGRAGYEILEVPISYNPRKYHEGKKIKWTDALKATREAVRVRFS